MNSEVKVSRPKSLILFLRCLVAHVNAFRTAVVVILDNEMLNAFSTKFSAAIHFFKASGNSTSTYVANIGLDNRPGPASVTFHCKAESSLPGTIFPSVAETASTVPCAACFAVLRNYIVHRNYFSGARSDCDPLYAIFDEKLADDGFYVSALAYSRFLKSN